MSGDVLPFPIPSTGVSSSDAKQYAEDFLACKAEDRVARYAEFHLDQAETLLAICQLLDQRIDSGPGPVLEATKQIYAYLQQLPEGLGTFLFDEREYYLGELALIAGACSRHLTLRSECREWLDRSAAWFLLTANSAGDSARVSYQRLALYMEERNLAAVLNLVVPLTECFRRTGARELALKCQFVEAAALRESGKTGEAADSFEKVCIAAREIGSARVLGPVFVALTQIYSDLERTEDAVRMIGEADLFLRSNGDRVSLAKLHSSVGLLLRKQNRPLDAVKAFRTAQEELLAMEMPADVAALHLVIADVLLDSGQERQAEWEIRAALPVIDRLKMVPEGFAAMSLLRESLRRRSIDRQALRNVHGYFEELSS